MWGFPFTKGWTENNNLLCKMLIHLHQSLPSILAFEFQLFCPVIWKLQCLSGCGDNSLTTAARLSKRMATQACQVSSPLPHMCGMVWLPPVVSQTKPSQMVSLSMDYTTTFFLKSKGLFHPKLMLSIWKRVVGFHCGLDNLPKSPKTYVKPLIQTNMTLCLHLDVEFYQPMKVTMSNKVQSKFLI